MKWTISASASPMRVGDSRHMVRLGSAVAPFTEHLARRHIDRPEVSKNIGISELRAGLSRRLAEVRAAESSRSPITGSR